MTPILYWVAQGVFAAVFAMITFSGALSEITLVAAAAIQLGLVGWRLSVARARPWLILLPPTTTLTVWCALAHWAAQEVGGDAMGLLAVVVSFGWYVLAYLTLGIWAGFRRTTTP